VSFTPRLLYPQGKTPWYSLDRRLGGAQSRSGRGGEEKNSQSGPESNPRTPIVQPVAQRCISELVEDHTRLKPRGHWDRLVFCYRDEYRPLVFTLSLCKSAMFSDLWSILT
jgi:hypothetical protein